METTKYALRPLLAEVRNGYKGMRDIRTSLKTSKARSCARPGPSTRRSSANLASYNSPGDLNDLEAILARYKRRGDREHPAPDRRPAAETAARRPGPGSVEAAGARVDLGAVPRRCWRR